MRVLFLSDPVFTTHERTMLSRLSVGLTDEGTRIAWSVPASMAAGMSDSMLVPVVPHQQPRLGLSVKQRAQFLLERVLTAQGKPPDIVHIFGGGVLRLGAEVARLAGAVPAFEMWRPNLEAATRIAANRALGPGNTESAAPRQPLLVAPNEAIQARLTPHFPDAIVRLIPWGVHASGDRRQSDTPTTAIVLIGPGRDGRAWQAGFRAAVSVLKNKDHVFLFADADATRRHGVWKHAKEAGVLERVSLMDNAESRRELAMRADILLYTDARGECRTILLDAMASGVAIVAATDPLAEALIDGRTARLVTDPTEPQWQEAIDHLVRDAPTRRRLTESAAEYVQANHRATRQIVSLIDAYEWLAGEPVRIGPPA